MRIDLHAHSSASDGTDTPAELVRAAADAGLDVVALTDHDTTSGWDAAAAALAVLDRPLALVPGVEVSCSAGGIGMHLLVHLADPDDPALAAEVARSHADRVPRAREMVRRLGAAGHGVTWDDVVAVAGPAVASGAVGRPHVADALVARGVVADRDAAFAELLGPRSPYVVRHVAPDPVDVVRLAVVAGGVVTFAHPGAATRGRLVGEDVVADLAAAGLAALEVDHPDHDAAARDRWRGTAADHGLLVTGSSDYHGRGKAQRLGAETTDPEAYAALLARARRPPLRALEGAR